MFRGPTLQYTTVSTLLNLVTLSTHLPPRRAFVAMHRIFIIILARTFRSNLHYYSAVYPPHRFALLSGFPINVGAVSVPTNAGLRADYIVETA